jgi:hypothetical protein
MPMGKGEIRSGGVVVAALVMGGVEAGVKEDGGHMVSMYMQQCEASTFFSEFLGT